MSTARRCGQKRLIVWNLIDGRRTIAKIMSTARRCGQKSLIVWNLIDGRRTIANIARSFHSYRHLSSERFALGFPKGHSLVLHIARLPTPQSPSPTCPQEQSLACDLPQRCVRPPPVEEASTTRPQQPFPGDNTHPCFHTHGDAPALEAYSGRA